MKTTNLQYVRDRATALVFPPPLPLSACAAYLLVFYSLVDTSFGEPSGVVEIASCDGLPNGYIVHEVGCEVDLHSLHQPLQLVPHVSRPLHRSVGWRGKRQW